MTDLRWTTCPRCTKREREISTTDGEMEMYCEVCNDMLAEQYRELKDWEYFHS